MFILIPVDGENGLDSKITTLFEMKTWALVEFDAGKAKTVNFSVDRTAFDTEWVDFIILENKFENYIEFMGEGIMCLVRRKEETVEEVVSAFAFKELDEIGV